MATDASKRSERSRATRWGLWALVGCAVWVVAMLAIGWPIGILLVPAGGPLVGWVLGGLSVLLFGERPAP